VGSSFDEGTITNDYNNKLSLGFGIEAEYILPFNNNKWSIMIEPTYQNYKSEATVIDENISGGQYTSKVNYSSIELPIGLRHYFFINKTSKIFLNASYVIDFSSKSEIEFNRPNGTNLNTLSINGRTNMAFGIGYKVFDKYNLEIRYQTNREILANNLFFSSEYQSLSLIFGYSLF
jgi:outer membrane autotransporter protein